MPGVQGLDNLRWDTMPRVPSSNLSMLCSAKKDARRLTGSWSRRAWVNDRRTEQHPGTCRFPSTFSSHRRDETRSGFEHAEDLHCPDPAFGAAVVALGVSIPAFDRCIRCTKQLSLYASK